ncbi:DUF2794 domain-containing protein [Alsobacter sp. R-9]
MSESDVSEPVSVAWRPGPGPATPPPGPAPQQVVFDREELRQLFNLYGRKVAEGEWRDYALDFLRDRAVFSVYRRATEYPLYRVEKDPRLARRQGAYSVVTQSGLVLKRGHDLDRVLRVLDKPVKLVDL